MLFSKEYQKELQIFFMFNEFKFNIKRIQILLHFKCINLFLKMLILIIMDITTFIVGTVINHKLHRLHKTERIYIVVNTIKYKYNTIQHP